MGHCGGYFGAVYWNTWCRRTGHVVSSDGTRGVMRRDMWFHRTGYVASSDGTRGVMRRDMWFHRTGHVVSLDWGTRWRSWISNCATSYKVAGSIPDGVIGIFHSHNPSDRTVDSNRNEYEEYFHGVKAAGA